MDETPGRSNRTIDERLDALAQSVELLAAMQRDAEKRMEATDKRLTAVVAAIEVDAENIRGLARIASAHEQRLADLEGGAR